MTNTESNTRPTLSLWLFAFAVAINLYLLGAACLLQAVAYPLLGDVSIDQLPAVHAGLTRRLGVAFILPELLAFVAVLPLFRWCPSGISKKNLVVCILLGVVYFALTFAWHLPTHKLLSMGNGSAMPALLASHALRTIVQAVKCGVLVIGFIRRQ
ncbi:MAG TPA: hypothetical protein PK156_45950 [Polyangium sp.]|nr:hypothetical protein [Polyangium sp.]